MKSLAFFSCVLATGAALASAVTSETTFGVLKVASTNAQTVISVPWEAVGTSGSDIKVKDFVKTTDMTDGDELYLYDSGSQSYKMWVLDGSENPHWVGTTTVTKKKTNITATAGDDGEDDTIARGQALIIVRANYNSGTTPAPAIYLYGQYNSTGVTEYGMAYATNAVKNTLFAPVNTTGEIMYLNPVSASDIDSGKKVVAASSWANVYKRDVIKVQDEKGNAIFLSWDNTNSKWGVYDAFANSGAGGWDYDSAVIQPGMGAWYQAYKYDSRAGAPKLTTTTVTGTK